MARPTALISLGISSGCRIFDGRGFGGFGGGGVKGGGFGGGFREVGLGFFVSV